MRRIIISSDFNNLNRFLKNEKEKFFYAILDFGSIDIEALLKERQYISIDIREGLDIDFGKEYADFIGRLNRDHNSLYWWANTISCKRTYVTDLPKNIFNYYCLTSLIKEQNHNLILVSDNSVLNNKIARYCRANGIECRLLDRIRKEGHLTHFRRCFLSSAIFLRDGWMRKVLVSIYLPKSAKQLLKAKKSYYVIKTWINETSFSSGDGYRDAYFGSLPEYLRQRKIDFFILGGIISGYKSLILKIRRVRKFPVILSESFIGYLDYIKVISLAFLNRPKITGPIIFCGVEVTDFLKQALKRDYEHNEVAKNLAYYYLTERLLKKVKVNIFIYTFENHAWERISLFSIRKYSPSTRIVGYAHSSFRPHVLGYFYSNEETGAVPLPDKVVTTGNEFTDILATLGNYENKVELKEGAALRYERLFKKDRLDWKRGGNILAALSQDMGYSLKLLRFLNNAFGNSHSTKIVLRSHPFMPAATIIKRYDMRLNDNFQISDNILLEDDLKDAGLVIYVNSTLCMEALMCGVPVVHLDLKEPLSLDPLFKLNSLKWTVADKWQLYRALEELYIMDDSEYAQRYNNARSYLMKYFYPVEEKYLEEFLLDKI